MLPRDGDCWRALASGTTEEKIFMCQEVLETSDPKKKKTTYSTTSLNTIKFLDFR